MTICHGIPWCRNGADDHCPFSIEGWWLFFYPLSYLTLTMVGAGFSKNAKSRGMRDIKPPDWGELADKMYCELYPKLPEMDEKQNKEWEKKRIIKTAGKNVTKLAEEYIVNFDKNKMNHLIENTIADDLFILGDVHKKLVKQKCSGQASTTAIIDLYGRSVVASITDRHITSGLAVRTLQKALDSQPTVKGGFSSTVIRAPNIHQKRL